MVAVFEPVELTWQGRTFVIPPERMLKAIAKIEAVLSFGELARSENIPLTKLAAAYGAVLRHAGARVTDEEVFAALFDTGASSAAGVLVGLWMMILPPSVRKKFSEVQATAEGETPEAPAVGKDLETSKA